ncbi:recombinase family protein [Roseibium sp.]|uniref:recombinase family protein n=1 Tax=Roseibium sp. TaxID=1936156 RepID=UPI003D0E7A2C
MIALLVARGFPRSVQPVDLSFDPSARFQLTCLQDAVSAANKDITAQIALGVGVEERIEANHPALRIAFVQSVRTRQRIVIDNVARLFDNHDWESALAFQTAMRTSTVGVYCTLHTTSLERLEPATLRIIISDRLHQSRERQEISQFRKMLQKQRVRAKPKVSAETPSQATQRLASYEDTFLSMQIHKLCSDWIKEDLSPPFTVRAIVDGLNEKGIQTQRGRPWTSPNLRKILRTKRKENPESFLFEWIQLPDGKNGD